MGETAAEQCSTASPEYPAWAEVGKEVVAILGNGTHPELILGRLTAVAASCRSALRGSMDRAGAPYPPRDAYGREVLDGELELEALASIRSALDALTEAVTAVVEYRTRGR